MEPDAEHEYQATYDLNVSYHDNAQSVVTRVNKITYSFDGAANLNMTPVFSQNLIALKDASINPLKGYLGEYEMRGNTLIDHSTFVADDGDGDMQFNVFRHGRASSERYHFHVVHEPHQHQHYRFGFGTPSEVIPFRRRKSM